VDRYVDLEGEELARRLHRAQITSMSDSQRRAYYARRRQEEEAALASGPSSSCSGLADSPQDTAGREMAGDTPPVGDTTVQPRGSGYLPAGYRSSSSSEVSWSFSSGQDISLSFAEGDWPEVDFSTGGDEDPNSVIPQPSPSCRSDYVPPSMYGEES
jgi:hypothetical protein